MSKLVPVQEAKTLTRMQPGMVVEFDGRPHNVIMVNDCRARIVSAEKKTVVVTDSRTGKESSFQRAEAGINISPESPLKILSYTKQK